MRPARAWSFPRARSAVQQQSVPGKVRNLLGRDTTHNYIRQAVSLQVAHGADLPPDGLSGSSHEDESPSTHRHEEAPPEVQLERGQQELTTGAYQC